MPACYIPYCESRSNRPFAKHVQYFSFPKENDLKQKWLEACGKSEKEIKIQHAKICERHFKADFFEIHLTKPRTKKQVPRTMRKLKKDAVPTELLSLSRKRKSDIAGDISYKQQTGIPTYKELIASVTEKKIEEKPTKLIKLIDTNEQYQIVDIEVTKADYPQLMEEGIFESDILEDDKHDQELLIAQNRHLKKLNSQLKEQNKTLVAQNKELREKLVKLQSVLLTESSALEGIMFTHIKKKTL